MDSPDTHSTWLASSVSCCLPWLQDRPQNEREAPAHDSHICSTQPGRIAPPTVHSDCLHGPPQWPTVASRTISSRASDRTSVFSYRKRKAVRRPTISGPFDFQQVATGATPRPNGSLRRTGSFRPLQLSIYIPGNELSPLPVFHDEWDSEDKALGLQTPAPVLKRARSETVLSQASTSFTIPRKPVPSRAVSMDATSRVSMDSNYTCFFSDYKYAAETLVSQTPRRQPSVAATTRSTQEFLDALDARLPRSPPPAVTLHPSKSVAEPPTLYRRASEQSLRLRTHLEERQQLERKGMECDTILEDIEKTPVVDQTATFPPEPIPGAGNSFRQDLSTEAIPTDHWSQPTMAPTFDESAFPMPASPFRDSKRSRVSAWLLRSMTSKSTLLTQSEVSTPVSHQHQQEPHNHHHHHTHPQTRDSSSSSASTLFSNATAAIEQSRPSHQLYHLHDREGGSVSTTWTTTTAAPTIGGKGHGRSRGMSLEFEKILMPASTITEIHPDGSGGGVGVAF